RTPTSPASASSWRGWSGGWRRSARRSRTTTGTATRRLRRRRSDDDVSSAPNPLDLITRVQRDVERSILRARNGLRYATTRANVGATPKDVVWRRDRAELWRYRSDEPIRYRPPVLIVHSLVSRSYILDLRPGSSSVEYFLGRGLDVFMLDWGVPDERDADNSLETYVDEYLPRAVAAVRKETG